MTRHAWPLGEILGVTLITVTVSLYAAADSFSISVPFNGSITGSPTAVSDSVSKTGTCGALPWDFCNTAVSASAKAGPGYTGAGIAASIDTDGGYGYNAAGSAWGTSSQDIVIDGPAGQVYALLNFAIDGSLSVSASGAGGANAELDASGIWGGSTFAGSMYLDDGGTLSTSGIFGGVSSANVNSLFASPLYSFVASGSGNSIYFSLTLTSSANAGIFAPNGPVVGSATAASNFADTAMFSPTGPVVMIFDADCSVNPNCHDITSEYTISTADGSVVNDHFVSPTSAPEPSTLLLLGSGLAGLIGGLRRHIAVR